MTNGTPAAPPAKLRKVDSTTASALVELTARFEDLQTVLKCCERLVGELAADGSSGDGGSGDGGTGDRPDEVLVEAVWTVALLSYARAFAPTEHGTPLTPDDLTGSLSNTDVLDWHNVLLQLRDHYADPAVNPREQFSVGVAQNDGGTAEGIAITSARQPLVDDLTVRQTGAIAFALSGLVNDRIAAQQEKVFAELKDASKADLDAFEVLDVATPDPGPDPGPEPPQ